MISSYLIDRATWPELRQITQIEAGCRSMRLSKRGRTIDHEEHEVLKVEFEPFVSFVRFAVSKYIEIGGPTWQI